MVFKLRELVDNARQEEKLPSVIGERCVHAKIETAGCKACVESCPQDAWVLDDEALGLDAGACDGCGLCVPACPEGAIDCRHEVVAGQWQGSNVAICACEYVVSAGKRGGVSCIHAIGLQDVLKLYQKGIKEWIVATADCDSCKRGQGIRLSDRLGPLNSALKRDGHTAIKLSRRSQAAWRRLNQEIVDCSTAPQLSRRGFLKGFINTGLQYGGKLLELSNNKQIPFTPLGRLLPSTTEETLWPCQPVIDSRLCDGCDACARLCPHHAVQLVEVGGRSSYQLNPQACSGCRVCVDVCERQAVSLYEWKRQQQPELPLNNFKCSYCGNLFHIPTGQTGDSEHICGVCARYRHNKKLYQVLS
ncbi:MAG: 4Fe-4S binding protein [Candidatus Thiodiazotropha sp. (ex Epidulcina cf. delphinae)]|nr:4Fe-4S binding protein [Candidatus Thiodiazotropha sp. (ex Epidulcina cf. delphinae)]